ncbi:RsmE family RNA methyltransferase [Helicobacter muridarum]|uniref:Ribosomal RNA small subunit methyltransferase E n=1 Tax=Helicobacter muridarum TaxID=216 RepID=A0A099U0I1_9HELI|nr:RsmE family RNA methyltransferase [Helicobacter muridarum]TLD99996.1 RsmE family RNA methyltransferase [Helicobacter muridarum]STQ87069.1 16S ribosomal RNA methyltransferase RsmE [Helicobacter muridarum]
MQFFYHKDAKNLNITLSAEDTHYIFVVRRFNSGSILHMRNLQDNILYVYQHVPSHKRSKQESFMLIDTISPEVCSTYTNSKLGLSLILAIIDLRDIYDILPTLNAFNVSSLVLFYAGFSQRNRIINMQKAIKILQYSCMQCNRIKPMDISVYQNLEDVLISYKQASFVDFAPISFIHTSSNQCNKHEIQTLESISSKSLAKQARDGIIIGPEGGFTQGEIDILQERTQYCLQLPYILTSHAVSMYIASLCCSPCILY